MHERDGMRLMQYLDGRLAGAEREAVEAWLAVDPEARRLAAEHRALWELLDECDAPVVSSASEEFRRRTLQRAHARGFAAWKPRMAALVAASLLVGVVVFAWHDAASRSTLEDGDLLVVGNLDLLENLDFLDEHGLVLDAAVAGAVLREFPAVTAAAAPAATLLPEPSAAGAPR